ncbi:hypothetical protein GUJ93_ZPchr0013g34124 [Zizania palustris]|uniref:Uncharacterized protein n=1 Tax=Zizania palustris TaxID=103762 RepID=A0A8J6BZ47_ZIZPA|nr:hypothetical protein GUJ93_ZPchr0013g34124 [Zizania palustris]
MAASSSPTPLQELAGGERCPHNPLLAAAAAASLLAFLYLPRQLLPLLLSPASLSSLLILLSLLRLCSPPPPATPPPPTPLERAAFREVASPPPPPLPPLPEPQSCVFVETEFASWAAKGRALEVIHEEFEAKWGPEEMGLPWTSDSESASYSGSDDGDGMIEIELEEDNLIEIDISKCRMMDCLPVYRDNFTRCL